jgi:DNA-binding NtrC family response regulator
MQLQQTLTGLLPRPGFDGMAIDPEEAARERILIVDDSATVRRSLSTFLSSEYDCAEAASALEAFQLLKEATFELVITDIIMPGISGIELVRKVVDNYPQTAVMVVSGVDRPQRALDAVRLGAFDYLIKPLDNEVLALTVKRALERRSLLMNAKKYKADLEARNEELIRGKEQLERLQAQIVQNEKMASIGQLAAGLDRSAGCRHCPRVEQPGRISLREYRSP